MSLNALKQIYDVIKIRISICSGVSTASSSAGIFSRNLTVTLTGRSKITIVDWNNVRHGVCSSIMWAHAPTARTHLHPIQIDDANFARKRRSYSLVDRILRREIRRKPHTIPALMFLLIYEWSWESIGINKKKIEIKF